MSRARPAFPPAALNVGPPSFAARFNALVNARRVAFEYDLIPQALCTPRMTACAGMTPPQSALLAPLGIKVVPTNMPGNVAAWSYTPVGGCGAPAAVPGWLRVVGRLGCGWRAPPRPGREAGGRSAARAPAPRPTPPRCPCRSMPFQAAGMPQDAAAWGALKNVQLCWTEQFL